MNGRLLLLVRRSWVILIPMLGFQQTIFGHHAEVMQGHPLIQGLSMPLHGLDHILMAKNALLLRQIRSGRSLGKPKQPQ